MRFESPKSVRSLLHSFRPLAALRGEVVEGMGEKKGDDKKEKGSMKK